jgi:hypothetical protein
MLDRLATDSAAPRLLLEQDMHPCSVIFRGGRYVELGIIHQMKQTGRLLRDPRRTSANARNCRGTLASMSADSLAVTHLVESGELPHGVAIMAESRLVISP